MKQLLINSAFPLFNSELKRELAQHGVLKTFKSGEVIVQESQEFTDTIIILSGCVQLVRIGQGGSEFVLSYLEKSQGLGVSISDDSPEKNKLSIMSVRAIELTYVLLIPFYEKDAMAKKHDQWYKYILQTAVQFYWIYIDLIDSIAFQKLDTRIEKYLHRLSLVKNSLILDISHQEIANGLNSSRETVSRLLKKMEDLGRIKLRHSTIEICR